MIFGKPVSTFPDHALDLLQRRMPVATNPTGVVDVR
jgi:hypothetical protein